VLEVTQRDDMIHRDTSSTEVEDREMCFRIRMSSGGGHLIPPGGLDRILRYPFPDIGQVPQVVLGFGRSLCSGFMVEGKRLLEGSGVLRGLEVLRFLQ